MPSVKAEPSQVSGNGSGRMTVGSLGSEASPFCRRKQAGNGLERWHDCHGWNYTACPSYDEDGISRTDALLRPSYEAQKLTNSDVACGSHREARSAQDEGTVVVCAPKVSYHSQFYVTIADDVVALPQVKDCLRAFNGYLKTSKAKPHKLSQLFRSLIFCSVRFDQIDIYAS